MNVIGRFMLSKARDGCFKDRPLIVVLDEAHQFLGRTIGDEYSSARLESFGLIAKEGNMVRPVCWPHSGLATFQLTFSVSSGR